MKTCLGYPVIGAIKTTCGGIVPVLDIKMMSDEEWRKYTEQGAIDNYKRHHEGHEPVGGGTGSFHMAKGVGEVTCRGISGGAVSSCCRTIGGAQWQQRERTAKSGI